MCDCLEKWFFRFYPSKKKETETPEGEWLRCVALISTILHEALFIFCLALVGFGPMIFNFLQGLWTYSIYLTLREREMAFYMILLIGQVVQCVLGLLGIGGGDDTDKLGAFQMGGMIANTVACGILLVMNGRAWYQFHESGGLHGVDAKMRK